MEPLYGPNPTAAHVAAMAAHILDSFGRIPYLLWGRLAVRLAGGRDRSRNPHLPDSECSFVVDDADLRRAVQVLVSGGFIQCTRRRNCHYRFGIPGSRIIPDLNGAMIPGLLGPPAPLVPYMLSSDPDTVPPRNGDRGSGYWRGLWPVRTLKPNALTAALLDCMLRTYGGLPGVQKGEILVEWLALLVSMIEAAYPPTMRLPPHLRALWRACNSRLIEERWQPIFLTQLVSRNYEHIPHPGAEEENEDDVARRAHFMVSRTQFVNYTRWQ
ncbi:hypothetical protein ASPACDRAFT_44650 [Aspergillus aculeatus ATCC 16872]|uniref:Uncharacterized protein n=1 Tax=Aspergillus aculeatus (strain ATCC 16872 / CBS 172.66 / WB 5094) TaxID=690307 RepID=A0A1L9WSD0_ASPA1|nr:uncharacterized protein ASPACDRAFT_44650 [Aspergillus aculeatus ATCC 16872]OJJ99022.1 hypothetical protein ASPACDRAFT_44650 [Aspergillus aculeatus ATCC 16872]